MATIRDVARVAGVSIATVSRVYNGSTRVSDATRSKVHAVAVRMDYWPNGAARSLTTNRTHAIGVLLPDLYGEFFSEVIRGIDQAARGEKFQVLVSSSHSDTEGLVNAARAMRGRIDGLIAMAPDSSSAAAIRQIAKSFPMVLLNPRTEIEGCGAISIANYEGAHAVVRHLLSLGHRRIAVVKGPPGNVDAEERLRGYHVAMAESGVELLPEFELPGDFTESAGYQAATSLLKLEPRPTAVFTANDYTAIGLMSALRDSNVDIPRDMAVVGFDDIAIAQYLSPSLTTVRVDARELGSRAVAQWLTSVRAPGSTPGRREVLATTLVVRNSSAPPAAGTNGRRPAGKVALSSPRVEPNTPARKRNPTVSR